MLCSLSWLRESHDDVAISLTWDNLVYNSPVASNNIKNIPTLVIGKGMSVS